MADDPNGEGGQTERTEHRRWLVRAQHEASKDFDKAVITLASGGLVISIAIVDKVLPGIPRTSAWLLERAWIGFGSSLTMILASFLVSQKALRVALDEHDSGTDRRQAGGRWGITTMVLNAVSAFALLLGIVFLFLFVHANFKGGGE